jgi:hypothetical protein
MRAAVGAAAAAACSSSNGGSGRQGPPRCHFFSTFFLNKLFQDTGQYNYANVSSAAGGQGWGGVDVVFMVHACHPGSAPGWKPLCVVTDTP